MQWLHSSKLKCCRAKTFEFDVLFFVLPRIDKLKRI
ncbi:unnamed protein product [Amoebophrya sp. A25]|nr:unnamed protein product [Amoebophrya sp. A25]|eukprot:GSA25T00022868001.1